MMKLFAKSALENSSSSSVLNQIHTCVFVAASVVALYSIAHSGSLSWAILDTELGDLTFVATAGTLLLGFLFAILVNCTNDIVMKWLQGLYLPVGLRWFAERRRKFWIKWQEEIKTKLVDSAIASPDGTQSIEREVLFLTSENRVLPFRLGNILRSAEEYPLYRYNIDPFRTWSLLWLLMPENGRECVQQARGELNKSVGSIQLSFVFVTSAIVMPTIAWSLVPLLIALVWFIASFNSVLKNAKLYSTVFRATYDLYRFLLYDQLFLPKPSSPNQELTSYAEGKANILNGFLREGLPETIKYNWRGLNEAEKTDENN